ncbi:hypothetical protein HZH66_005252 [Vespula vulgaris]|uniref:Uncharacterized protein n=1 Tax=Vespula vulgaris TaxID=7454 RepID=A0A834KAK7_VESVU|nr:hypothetical protein HZH66_005252 [Vespula vulgaris]
MLVIVSAVQVDHAGQALSQPQSRPGHQQSISWKRVIVDREDTCVGKHMVCISSDRRRRRGRTWVSSNGNRKLRST